MPSSRGPFTLGAEPAVDSAWFGRVLLVVFVALTGPASLIHGLPAGLLYRSL